MTRRSAIMGIFRDIVTAIKGGASEVGEAIVDVKPRILNRNPRSTNGIQKPNKACRNSAGISLAKDLSIVNADIERYTEKARQALERIVIWPENC